MCNENQSNTTSANAGRAWARACERTDAGSVTVGNALGHATCESCSLTLSHLWCMCEKGSGMSWSSFMLCSFFSGWPRRADKSGVAKRTAPRVSVTRHVPSRSSVRRMFMTRMRCASVPVPIYIPACCNTFRLHVRSAWDIQSACVAAVHDAGTAFSNTANANSSTHLPF